MALEMLVQSAETITRKKDQWEWKYTSSFFRLLAKITRTWFEYN